MQHALLHFYAVSALYSLGTDEAQALWRIPRNIRKSPPLCSTATARRVAPVGLYSSCSSLPRVWSPLQGYAPWALKRIAPIGAQPCRPRLLEPLGAYYSALGGTVLLWGACTHVPVGTQIAAPLGGNTTIPLEEQRCLGGHIPRTLRCAYCCASGGNTAVLVSRTAVPWEHILQHLERKYRNTREQNCGALGAHTAAP